jgi:hypothetical protein
MGVPGGFVRTPKRLEKSRSKVEFRSNNLSISNLPTGICVLCPPELLPFGGSRGFFLLFDEVDVLLDDMFSDLGSEVDEVHVLVQLVEGFDTMVVFEIAVYSDL